MNLGQTIYRLRMERNMSQGDLADALDVSRQSVSKWENNSATPELEKVIHMAQIFDITIDELVTGKSPASPSGSTLPPTKTLIGIALLCCSVVSMVLFLLFALHIWIALITLPLGIISAVCLAPNEKFLRLILICVGVIFFSVVLIFAIILIFHLYRTLIHTA
jgi:transcriptional regulator with XRE-family HTH domain